MICKEMTEEQARHNVRTAVEAAMVSTGLIADKSGSAYAKKIAAKLAKIVLANQMDALREELVDALQKPFDSED